MTGMSKNVTCMFGVPHGVHLAEIAVHGEVERVFVAGTHHPFTKDVTLVARDGAEDALRGMCLELARRRRTPIRNEEKRHKVVMLQVVQRVGAPPLAECDLNGIVQLYLTKREAVLGLVPIGDLHRIIGPEKPANPDTAQIRVIYFEEEAVDLANVIANHMAPLFGGDVFVTSAGEPAYLYTLQCSTKKKIYRQCIGHRHNPYSDGYDKVYSSYAAAKKPAKVLHTHDDVPTRQRRDCLQERCPNI
eukprot:TRINITY_DN627_c0_g2_i3.p1 TRINITY_DN627_c0_g2~~TRINITY_DN627_c0_g2_i3.p1  ORF type:complete len:246 (+),score=77.95 TRINITY_DN627_c0_g2_i3:30-767(+)